MPRTRTRRFGPRSFRVSGPVVWNSLLEDIRIPELSLERFKSMLKTHLFRQANAQQRSQRFFDLVKERLISVSYIYIHIYILTFVIYVCMCPSAMNFLSGFGVMEFILTIANCVIFTCDLPYGKNQFFSLRISMRLFQNQDFNEILGENLIENQEPHQEPHQKSRSWTRPH